ncbi:ParB-like nuclease domain-containing protein, partial [Gilliamella sp. B2923]|uniref:ParB/RepB/Spo0J family partition protein n=1 Tax=Gilliamella sp. B2923 TaxID=2818005 RepID=UPI00226A92E6
LELQHGKGNVEQGGGNYKETKDKILDNQAANQKANESSKFGEHVAKEQQINAGKGANVTNSEHAIKNVNPKSLISRQNSNEMSGSDIKRLVKDMKTNGFDTTQPIDVAIVNGKMIIIDGHHRAAAAVKAGIKDIPIRINKVTEAQGNQLLLEAAEARSRY